MMLRPQSPNVVPSFAAARTRRQQARAAGLHPDYWYAVEYAAAVPVGRIVEARFWGRSIALFRGSDGVVHALENRCAHRQVKLSLGEVNGCNLTCPYHGWTYDGAGTLVSVPHELFGRQMPRVRIASFPVRTRYGLIWIFPGDPARAEAVSMPELPELEGAQAWACVPLDFTWQAHHSLIIENVSDFTHAHLHRKYRPFSSAKLVHYEPSDNEVRLTYDVLVGDGRLSRHFVDRQRIDVNHMVRIPLTRVAVPRWLMSPLLRISNRLMIRPLLMQDGAMVEAEQRAYEAQPDAPAIELNPVVIEFQQLIIEEWRRHCGAGNAAEQSAREPTLA